jgi:hypothetical protein
LRRGQAERGIREENDGSSSFPGKLILSRWQYTVGLLTKSFAATTAEEWENEMLRVVATVLAFTACGAVLAAEPLVVTLDKTEILRLDQPARRVIVGNPAIADVSLENSKLMYVVAKAPGETNLIVLGDGDVPILSRPVVVTGPSERSVSVHVPTSDGPSSRVYSCIGDRCLRVPTPDAISNAGAPAALTNPATPLGASPPSGTDILNPGAPGSAPLPR